MLKNSQIASIVILFEEINAVTDAPHYFLACKKEGNISSINGAIGLHCGCEITSGLEIRIHRFLKY